MKKFASLVLVLFGTTAAAFTAPLKAILIEGSPNAPSVKAIFESGGLFQAETAAASNTPTFEKYRVVVLNSNELLPMSALTSLDKYLMGGGGLVVLAGAGSALPDLPESNLMLGVTEANNRDRRAGPLWFYKDGNVAFDATTSGPAGKALPPDKPFLVTIRNTEHPVTKGLPLEWLHVADVLEGNLRGPGKNMILLATAFSDAAKGGTGRNEAQIVAVTYGKGRVFHSILGRTPEALECAGLQTMLQRGAEWAATGKVTLKVPTDFPDEEKISRRAIK